MVTEMEVERALAGLLGEKLEGLRVAAPVEDVARLPERWVLVHFTGCRELVPGNRTVWHDGEVELTLPAGLPEDAEGVYAGVCGALAEVLSGLQEERWLVCGVNGAVYVYEARCGSYSVGIEGAAWVLRCSFSLVVQY